MAKNRNDVPAEQPGEPVQPVVEEGDVIHPRDAVEGQPVVDPAVQGQSTYPNAPASPPPAATPTPQVQPDTGQPAPAGAAVPVDPNAVSEAFHPGQNPEDQELAAQEQRIAELQRQIDEETRNQRMDLVNEERRQRKENLDNREAELQAQLARVRGEEPHEENR